MKRVFLISLLLYASMLMAAAQDFILTPQWTPQSQFAGYYAAYEKGFYKEAGIDVEIVHPSKSSPTLQRLQEGACNIITLELIQAIIANDRNAGLVNILQTTQHSTLAIAVHDSGIKEFEELAGCRIGTWKAGFDEIPMMIDKEKNLGIEWVEFMTPVNLYIAGAIDASLVKTYNELFTMKMSGIKPGSIIYFSDKEYDFPEDGLYVKEDFYKRNKAKCQAFADASRKGWEWARKNREEALEICMKFIKEGNVVTNMPHQQWTFNEILSAQEENQEKGATYMLDRDDFDRVVDMLLKFKYISSPLEYDRFIGGGR